MFLDGISFDEHDDEESDYDEHAEVMERFRRGTLIPLQPTLAAQMGAIAREYALPSTGGMEVYLISPLHGTGGLGGGGNRNEPSSSTLPSAKLTDPVWNLLWSRVVRAEREERLGVFRTLSGLGVGNMTPVSSRSATPILPTVTPSQLGQLSGILTNLNKSTPSLPTMSSPGSATAFDNDDMESNLNLNSSSPIPILAKLEFELDRRRGGWYDRWRRKRVKDTQAKPNGVASGRRDLQLPAVSDRERSMQEEIDRLRAIVSRQSKGYVQLDEDQPSLPSFSLSVDQEQDSFDNFNEDDDEDIGSDVSETEMLPHMSNDVEQSIIRRLRSPDDAGTGAGGGAAFLAASRATAATVHTLPKIEEPVPAPSLRLDMFSDFAALEDVRASAPASAPVSGSSGLAGLSSREKKLPEIGINGFIEGDNQSENESGEEKVDDEEDVLALWEAKKRPTLNDLPPLPPLPPLPSSPPLKRVDRVEKEKQESTNRASTSTTSSTPKSPPKTPPEEEIG